jgi:hypothetical protein
VTSHCLSIPIMSIPVMSQQASDIWVKRLVCYYRTYDKSLDPLRDNLSPANFVKLYDEAAARWSDEQKANSSLAFAPRNIQAQEIFYDALDAICASLENVAEDDIET